MLTSFYAGLLATAVTQGGASAVSPVLITALVTAGLLAVATVFFFLRLRQTEASLTALREQNAKQNEEQRALQQTQKKQQQKLEARLDEAQSLKKDLSSLRKKHHQAQQEAKQLREQLKEAESARRQAEQQQPAFAEPPEPQARAGRADELAQAEQQARAEPQPAPAPEPASAPASESALEAEIKKLKGKVSSLNDALEAERGRLKQLRRQQRTLQKKVENYRRVDVITKSRYELLHDKLRTMGRQYYEAVSELALLKGEVAPPAPADEPGPSEFNAEEDASAAGTQPAVGANAELEAEGSLSEQTNADGAAQASVAGETGAPPASTQAGDASATNPESTPSSDAGEAQAAEAQATEPQAAEAAGSKSSGQQQQTNATAADAASSGNEGAHNATDGDTSASNEDEEQTAAGDGGPVPAPNV